MLEAVYFNNSINFIKKGYVRGGNLEILILKLNIKYYYFWILNQRN